MNQACLFQYNTRLSLKERLVLVLCIIYSALARKCQHLVSYTFGSGRDTTQVCTEIFTKSRSNGRGGEIHEFVLPTAHQDLHMAESTWAPYAAVAGCAYCQQR